MSEEFQLELSSDDVYSKIFFPKNNASKYTFKLPRPLHLSMDDSWSVGLSEISLPTYWVNIDYPNNVVRYGYREGSWYSIILPPGHYRLEDFFHAIKEPFVYEVDKNNFFTMKYDNKNSRIIIKSSPRNAIALKFPYKLAKLLGFLSPNDDDNHMYLNSDFIIPLNVKKYWAPHTPLLEMTKPDFFFIYTDIILSTVVGGVYAPLLRAVHFPHDDSHDLQSRYFKKPHYVPLLQPYFHAIEVNIREINGELASFGLETPTSVILHFAKNISHNNDESESDDG